jgi:hypothetical protein
MLDEWAGSPPSGAVLIASAFRSADPQRALDGLLREWEAVAAEMLETQLSYPILCFFRSQHDDQSWLTALHAVLDACTIVIGGIRGIDPFQAQHTFAICRHTVVDVSQNLMRRRPPPLPPQDPADVDRVREWLGRAGVLCDRDDAARDRILQHRELYRGHVDMLAEFLLAPPAGWLPAADSRYNWRTTDRSLHAE